MPSWFVAVTLLPLGDFTPIGFSAVLIAALVARVGLKEPLGFDRLLAILAGLAGALVIVRPSPAGISAGAAAALFSALMVTLSRVSRASIRPSLLRSPLHHALRWGGGGLHLESATRSRSCSRGLRPRPKPRASTS
jgi:drug/metabolite transporter (DMT)-like permease